MGEDQTFEQLLAMLLSNQNRAGRTADKFRHMDSAMPIMDVLAGVPARMRMMARENNRRRGLPPAAAKEQADRLIDNINPVAELFQNHDIVADVDFLAAIARFLPGVE